MIIATALICSLLILILSAILFPRLTKLLVIAPVVLVIAVHYGAKLAQFLPSP